MPDNHVKLQEIAMEYKIRLSSFIEAKQQALV